MVSADVLHVPVLRTSPIPDHIAISFIDDPVTLPKRFAISNVDVIHHVAAKTMILPRERDIETIHG